MEQLAGGNGGLNDCLWDCLSQSIGRMPWKNAAVFNHWLGLKRTDNVPVEMMSKIEEYAEAKITVSGHGKYDSDYQSPKGIVIDVKIENEHYTLLSMEEVRERGMKWVPRGASLKPKLPVHYCFEWSDKEHPIIAYIPSNPEGKRMIRWFHGDKTNSQTFQWHKSHPRSSPYGLVRSKAKRDLKKDATYWAKCQKALFDATDGEIDLFCFESVKNAAVHIWRSMTLQYHPDPIEQEESDWLMLASNGPTTWWTKQHYHGPGVQLDFNIFYPSLLSEPEFATPMKKPKFVTLDEDYFDDEKYALTLGVYRCKIDGDTFLWRERPNCHYTSYAIRYARQRYES